MLTQRVVLVYGNCLCRVHHQEEVDYFRVEVGGLSDEWQILDQAWSNLGLHCLCDEAIQNSQHVFLKQFSRVTDLLIEWLDLG